MKNKIAASLMLLILLANSMSVAATQPYYGGSSGHYYQVIFDGEGEASVIAKIVQTNYGKENINNVTLEIPGRVNVRYILQEVPVQTCENYCIGYGNVCSKTDMVCDNWNSTSQSCSYWESKCTQFSSVCSQYSSRCYDSYERSFIPLEFNEEQLSSSKKLIVGLSKPVAGGKEVKLVIYYKVFGYVNRELNLNFDFETIKSPYDTPYLRVAVDVDDDLSLKGGDTKTTYISNFNSLESFSAPQKIAIAGDQANLIGSISDNVVYAGGYVKTKSNLDPWESFHVAGRYNGKNVWFLNYYEEIIGFIVAVVVVNLLMNDVIGGISNLIKKLGKSPLSRIISRGFISAAAVALTTAIMYAFSSSLSYLFRNQVGSILVVVAGMASILFSIAFPAYYHAQKYGNKEGALVLLSTIAWLFVMAYAISAIFGNNYYYAIENLAKSV